MTGRNIFAAVALHGLLQRGGIPSVKIGETLAESLAKEAFAIADAMVREALSSPDPERAP
jgi:hypothetical protein